MGPGTGTVIEIVVGDEPAAWRSAGFDVDGEGACAVGGVRLRLVGGDDDRGRGLLGWTLDGVVAHGPDIDGLPTATASPAGGAAPPAPGAPGRHANGAVGIDHVVVLTPDLDRTTAALEAAGVAARRTREAGRGRLQRFFRLGEVVVELVGPAEPAGEGPARFWGLAFTVADIDAAAAELGDRVSTPKAAVQPGRRIATLRGEPIGVSVPVAFMSVDEGRTRPSPGDAPGGAGGGCR